jgi:hypothetical protein
VLRLGESGASEVAIVSMGGPDDIARTIATLGQVAAN